MRKVILFLLLIISLPVFSQQLEMTVQGQSYMVEYEPNQRWLITKGNTQFNIYTEDFELITSFNLGTHQNYVQYIYQVARDLDDDNNIAQGNHSLVWDGRDDNNKILASGTYFYKLAVNGIEKYKKVLVLK